MVKTNLILCDSCKSRIGKTKCGICNKDLCEGCVAIMGTEIKKKSNQGSFKTIQIHLCQECYLKLVNADRSQSFFENDFMNKLKKEVVDYIKKKLILENLKDENSQ